MSKKPEPLITRVETIARRWGVDYAVYGVGLHGAVVSSVGYTRPGIDCPNKEELIGLTYRQACDLLQYYDRVATALELYERELEAIERAKKNIEHMQVCLQKRIQKAAVRGGAHIEKVAALRSFKQACHASKAARQQKIDNP